MNKSVHYVSNTLKKNDVSAKSSSFVTVTSNRVREKRRVSGKDAYRPASFHRQRFVVQRLRDSTIACARGANTVIALGFILPKWVVRA
jgi:hypothetical protein